MGILDSITCNDRKGITLPDLVLHNRHCHLQSHRLSTPYSLKQIVLELVPVLVHIRSVHEQLHHDSASLEIVLDRLRICATNRSLAVQLSPGHYGLRLPLSLVDRLLYPSESRRTLTLIEVTEHHQCRTLLGQLVRVANRHVERLCQTDAVAHGHTRLHVLAVLVAVLLPVTPLDRPNRLKEATDIGLNGLIGRSTPEGELRLDRVPHPYHPGLVKIL